RRVHTLAHFGPGHGEHDGAISRDLDPAVERNVALERKHHLARAQARARGQHAPPDDECAGRTGRAPEHGATLHDVRIPAARLMATRTRWYVPQRQMFVIASSICASVGFGVFSSRAAAAISMPLWQ